MSIISKYKDYYDYLQGIYGIDEKLILDRRSYIGLPYTPSSQKLIFYIAGYIIEGYWDEDVNICTFGTDLVKFDRHTNKCYIPPLRTNRDYSKSIWLHGKQFGWLYGGDWYYTNLVKDVNNTNEQENCPILLKSWSNGRFIKYPILKDFNLPSYISAEKMYNMLSEWLSNQITKREQISEMSDVLKIESKGFDTKRSFRPKMK